MILKERLETTNLSELCNLLTQEITQLATSDYKLKLMYVLVHIIEESKKALETIDTTYFTTELKEVIGNACKQGEKQLEIAKLRYSQDRMVRDAIDSKNNNQIESFEKQIEQLMYSYEEEIRQMINYNNSLSIPEKDSQNK